MKTAAYTICKNEINRVEQWLHYTKDFDYRVILDTGSTDGTYEAFKKVPGIILDQMIIEPFRYDIPRNKNLAMIPQDVNWCLSPDVDEYFSINVLEEIEKTIKKYPNVTNIATTRLDVYSKSVFVGPPYETPTNKIHRRHMYEWRCRVYEHLWYIGPGNEVEKYNDKIFLVHDQEVNKPRSDFYFKLMQDEYKENPLNAWNNSFLIKEYYKRQDIENYVDVGINFIKSRMKDNHKIDDLFKEVMQHLQTIAQASNVEEKYKRKVSAFLTNLSLK